ncbi:sporulation initiation phosphotransferase F [bacterium BMS3Bbin06]|nr:sporulation initiation phosphotransferase F [bacterium BMS3Abin08]GBE35002.1 sporulation initiation phosphotransferase F [bacterium BMS3Bbin06]HDO36824.1 response regulator [Nitrospirota bacterium]HDY71124.1 response regulator [Nitrospirota bacterium]
MKVMIVDDEQLVRWFMERALKRKGIEVSTVSNIHDAMNLIEHETFDIIFTDLKMPGGNGAILVDKLCEKPQKTRVVVCSAYITSEISKDLKGKGIYTLKKPFKLKELEDTIKKIAPDI